MKLFNSILCLLIYACNYLIGEIKYGVPPLKSIESEIAFPKSINCKIKHPLKIKLPGLISWWMIPSFYKHFNISKIW